MSRYVVIAAFFALTLQAAQAQVFSHGIPASVTSPEPDGRTHGVPASVVSPTQLPFGVNPPLRSNVRVHGPLRRFGTPGHRGRPFFVPVPVFYSFYTDGAYPSVVDPYVPDSAPPDPAPAQQQASTPERGDEELRAAYLQGARDALAQQKDESRYGEHYLDSRERERQQPATSQKNERSKRTEEAAAPPVPREDKIPATVFIFKDGHQLETKNYAIMGETLFDFSGNQLKKIKLEEIDSAATMKANDDRGVQVKLQ